MKLFGFMVWLWCGASACGHVSRMEVSFPFMVDLARAADSPLPAVRFAYDGRGRLTNRTDAVAATAYTYDAGNLLLR
jgi:hypothetical protein